MWIDLIAGRLVFPSVDAAKGWLAAVVAPFEVATDDGPWASAYWAGVVERAAMIAGHAPGDAAAAPVAELLRRVGQVTVRGDEVTFRGSHTGGETQTMGLVLGALSAFVRAAEHGGRGCVFELGVQQVFTDDAADLVHWLDDEGMHGITLPPEESLAIREQVRRFDTVTFDETMYEPHPSGADTEVAD